MLEWQDFLWHAVGDYSLSKLRERPSLVSITPGKLKRKGSVRFFNFWTEHHDFLRLVESVWANEGGGYSYVSVSFEIEGPTAVL